MYQQLFKRIIEASQTKSLTFFVGAGVSKLSDAPKWSELIDAFSDSIGRAKKTNYSNEEYLSIPQMYYYSIDQDVGQYYDFINNCFGSKKLVPNSIHKMLLDLNPHAFITTNFDNLLETAASENCQSFKVIACDDEISQISGNRFILKLHGDLNHRNIVLKEEDYLNYSENFKLVETLLKSIFATNTVVFIGYGLNDYNIKLILNWTKTLLKEKFNKPIFIYTDDAELSKDELRYHESKGLYVVDYRYCVDDNASCDFIDRYRCVLNSINESSILSLKGKDEIASFELLYNLLAPLDKMKALRIQDIREKLHNKVIIESNGVINLSAGENILLKHFVTINDMDKEDREKLNNDTIQKYQTIVSVFSKARIGWIRCSDNKHLTIADDNFVFANPWCIQFDYGEMQKYVSVEYVDYQDNYKKAYYLAKLNRYKKSYELFVNVATAAYIANDYLLHFLAQANRYIVYQAMKSANNNLMYYNTFDFKGLNGGTISAEQVEHMFERLPIEFQNEYHCFKNIASFNMLYENSYYSLQDGIKLQEAIESNTIEWGVTSADKVIIRINQNLHFFLGNGLYMEEFTEFKTTIRSLMSTLVHKYSVQTKKIVDDDFFGKSSSDEIYFDNIDFYCFVEYFDVKQLNKLFHKHSIKTLDFQNIEIIESSVKKLFSYYAEALKTKQRIEISSIQNKIARCLNLLRYMNISQELVDFVCSFIFKYEFYEICIGDKILFLDSQLWKRKKYSVATASIVENKLIYYIDKHIEAIINNESFDLLSKHSNLNYPNLIHYISPDDCFKSRKLAYRITKIIKNSYMPFKKETIWHYYPYLSASQQKSVINWICEGIANEFSFDNFLFLINYDVKLDKKILMALKKYLKKQIELSTKKSPIKTYPKHDHFEALNLVGYFCRAGSLKRKDFSAFLNYSPIFDLFYKFEKFDFDNFDVTWLLNWQDKMFQMLSENKIVRSKTRECIAKEINLSQLKDSDLKRLSTILTKYFC